MHQVYRLQVYRLIEFPAVPLDELFKAELGLSSKTEYQARQESSDLPGQKAVSAVREDLLWWRLGLFGPGRP